MDPSSPTKRRVLGALDPNVSSPKQCQPPKQQPTTDLSVSQQSIPCSAWVDRASELAEPASVTEGDRKRSISTTRPSFDSKPSRKRPCLGDAEEPHILVPDRNNDRQRSTSPDTSSLFDNSITDTSQLTTVTEPDIENPDPVPFLGDREMPIPVPPRPQPSRSPEDIKRKAEILRVRLGLARYKVKTGQPDVTLDQLEAQAHSCQVGQSRHRDRMSQLSCDLERSVAAVTASAGAKARRPLPTSPPTRRTSPPPVTGRQANSKEAPTDEDEEMGNQENDAGVLPKLPRDIGPPTTPRRTRPEDEERRLSSSALQNGAVSGLLSLSRSSEAPRGRRS
ncbi:putative cyclin-dependent kinase [Podospora aff. communis PSN243]|uniref:Cyclin-dependent kinase n=1 Tax=Podospora aff. communis PSN243 TaxID=3040156 RepID=A0AAV9H5J0_9PEZI|nr:putative cyclin-dependent kinase [Podospora aff. communis PSN243]